MLKVSVIVPVYNVEKYFGECLESLRQQSLQSCEFICIDDGSQDDSYKIAEAYIQRDKRFKLIRQENKGLAETRNVGIENAKGKYLAFLDSDDLLSHKDVLKSLYQKAEEYELEILSFETELLYEAGMKEKEDKDFYYYKKNRYEGLRTGKELFHSMMSNHEFCDSACLLFIKRAWLSGQGISFYPGIYYEDALFCVQCFLHAVRMMHLSEKFYTYRIREKSIMTTRIRWENVYSRVVVYREILRMGYLPENAEPELQKSLMEYLSMVMFHVKYLDEFRVDEQPEAEMEPLDKILLQSMELGKYRITVNERVILNGLEKTVADSDGVILYGAGKVGKLFYCFLKERKLEKKVLCYAVSHTSGRTVSSDGVRVLSIEEAVKKPGLIFLSVIVNDARMEMEKNLHMLGIEQFEIFDAYIYRALRHEIRRIEKREGINGDE